MTEKSDKSLLSYRRRSLLARVLSSGLLTVAGIAIAVSDEPKVLGYLASLCFGFLALCWTLLLSLPPGDLLEMPASCFRWPVCIAPEDHRPSSGIQATVKQDTATAGPRNSESVIRDRDMDGPIGESGVTASVNIIPEATGPLGLRYLVCFLLTAAKRRLLFSRYRMGIWESPMSFRLTGSSGGGSARCT